MKNIKKIAALRANALGDFIFVLPALQALKKTYSDAEIVYLGKDWHKDFLQSRPSPIDRVVVVPDMIGITKQKGVIEDKKAIKAFFKRMREERFDIAIQLHGGGQYSNPFVKKLGAKRTIGLQAPGAQPLDISIPYVYYQNEVLRYLEVVSRIGARTTYLEPSIEVTNKDRKEVQNISFIESPFIVLHPGSTDIKRRWFPERFARVGDYFSQKGYHIIITGTQEEKKIIAKVQLSMRFQVDTLCNKLSLGGLAALLKASSVVIANDTGPLHLARAVGAKTVGIFWCGNLINGGPLRSTNHRSLLSWIVFCPLCGRNIAKNYPFDKKIPGCKHLISFVCDITADEVIQKTEELLEIQIQKQ